jgi:hypothetical protein
MMPLSLMAVVLATGATTRACPVQPEPAALTSAAFRVPSHGETLLFSTAPSFQSIRYALRIVRSSGARTGSAVLIRLMRRFDCNVHDPAGEWKFRLSPEETDALFSAVTALEMRDESTDVVIHGTWVEFRHYVRGKLAFSYASNGPPKEQLSKVVLDVVAHHVPANELPRSDDWRYQLPGTPH